MEKVFEIFLVSMISFLKVSKACDNGWFEYGKHCYFFQNKTLKGKSWSDASISCQVKGGHLLSIEDQAENSFIKNILKDDTLKKDNYWIRLNDDCNNREFMWSDDKYLKFSNWLPKKPNNAGNGENCVETNKVGWNDNDCFNYNGFICKFVKENNNSCDHGWINYKNFCYLFQSKDINFYGVDWFDSYFLCLSKGGNLVSIEDQEENSFITSILERNSMKDQIFWIGLNYLISHKRFVWSDHTKWNLKVPIENILPQTSNISIALTRCVVINANSWSALSCYDKYGYICKVKRERSCVSDWFEFSSYCYYFHTANDSNGKKWEHSYLNCLEKGGNLLSIDDETENTFILNTLKNYNMSKDNYWIGLTDRWYNSWFLWSDNTYTQYMYSKFNGLFYDVKLERCVRINKANWETKNCKSRLGYICKSKKAINQNCAEGWIGYGKHCYLIRSLKEFFGYTWLESFSSCQSKGGNLVSINNEEENRFIQNSLIKDNSDYWIGLSKLWNYRRFVWSDNTYVQFFNWIGGEPDTTDDVENCVEMNSNGWSDKECTVLNGFICKVKRVNLDYVNHKDEIIITHGFLFGTLRVLKKEYTISFNLKPTTYSKGLKSVLQLVSSNKTLEFSNKHLGVWFHEDGSGSLVITAAVSGNSYFVKTDPLILGQWSNIKIYQWLFSNKYWFAIDINGITIHQIENPLVADFEEIHVYVSNLWDNAQNGSISEFIIINRKARFLIEHYNTPLIKGKIIAEIPKIYKEYLVSFDFNPMVFETGLHSIIHFTIGGHVVNKRNEILGIWLDENGSGKIKIVTLINGKPSLFKYPIHLNIWSNIEVCQSFNGLYYVFTIRINGHNVFSIINNQAQDLIDVKVYASNPWDKVQNGSIKNFLIINGILNIKVKPLVRLDKVSISTLYPNNYKVSVISVAILVPVLTVLIAVIFVIAGLRFRRKKCQKSLNLNPYTINQHIGCGELLTDEWEIFPEDIIKDKKIGEGAFGTVFAAKLSLSVLSKRKNMKQNPVFNDILQNTSDVAVKLVKDSANTSELNDFFEEINLMKKIGFHKNIVNLIGCSTLKKPLCLIFEYMEHGDLLNFLRKRRTKFCALNLDGKSSVNFMYTPGYQQSLKNEILLKDNGTLTPDDLLSFAWQVASGMEFLSCSKLVHRDLAARNILVGSGKVVKVSDFGLTRKINDELNYMSKKKRHLPVKWMSIEAIFDHLFTSFSDVWAYGVVLFEIVTLGGVPYPTISNHELLSLLKSGYRMEKPENCSERMFEIMLQCWNEDPLQRPTFTTLREYFDDAMSQGGYYLHFEFDENTAPSFLPFETDDDDNNTIEEEVFQNPVHVKSIEHLKKFCGESILPLETCEKHCEKFVFV
ncbi:uncharacterized protein LOC100212148 isoform X3 [Hydra vulgaris]|uniref:uncharacterized protein LOC100212148 isoform X3 n=1 Tax=Hydra vulgaris TaxID=6087 RepID=UPI0032EA1B40